MAYKVLGQSSPSATTNTDIYTVPSAKSAVVSTISVCNTSSSAITYRIAVRPAGATIATAHYNAYGVQLAANSTDYITIGITLAATDVITVWASAVDVAFSVFGDES